MSTIPWISQEFKENSEKVKQIQLGAFFALALSSTSTIVYYHYSLLYGTDEWANYLFDKMCNIVGVYMVADLFYCTKVEAILHHVFVLGCLAYAHFYGMSPEDKLLFTYPLLKTEITSIFYGLKCCLPENSVLYSINDIVLYLTFLKFRIYDFYYSLLHKNLVFDDIFNTYSYSYSHVLWVSCYGLYSMNLYWTLIMTKIACKSLLKSVEKISHCICHCIHLHHVHMALLAYRAQFQWFYLYDFVGIGCMTVYACRYHRERFIDYEKKENEQNVILYDLSIQARSILVLATHYYTSPQLGWVMMTSVMAHLTTLYMWIWHVVYRPDLNQDGLDFLKNSRAIALPLMYDGIRIVMNSSHENQVPLILVYLMLMILYTVRPFYTCTNVSLALGMLAQTHYLAKSIQTY